MPNFMVVDLSHHNAKADFTTAKQAGVVGVIHKASQGTTFADAQYGKRRKQAQAAGLLWGAYHFGNSSDVDAQVKQFLKVAAPDDDTLVALDFERNEQTPSNTMTLAQAKKFLRAIEKTLGRKAVVYGGSLLHETLGKTPDPYLAQHRLWWAQYTNAPNIQASWKQYWLWQHTDGFHGPDPKEVLGIGHSDCDTFDGSAAALRAAWAS